MKTNISAIAEVIRTRFRNGEAKLPVLPEAVIEVRNIVNDEQRGASDIAQVLAKSTTFSATVLRLANSPQFKTGNYEVRSLPMAIQRLGGRRTLHLMVAISAKLHINVKDKGLQEILRKSRNHSLDVAVAAQHLAKLLHGSEPEEAFLAGMLHDIGVQAIICAVSDLLIELSVDEQLAVISQLHREMGGRLLNYWNMPNAFEMVATHHGVESDDRPRDKLIDFVDSANFLIQHFGHKVLFDQSEDIDPLHYPPLKRIGATEVHLAAVEVELEENIKMLQESFH